MGEINACAAASAAAAAAAADFYSGTGADADDVAPERRGWTHAGLKLQLLTQGGDACSLKRRSERNIFYKYYAEDTADATEVDSFGELIFSCFPYQNSRGTDSNLTSRTEPTGKA